MPDSGTPAGKREADENSPLFRHEVMAERQTPWLGTVLIEPKFSHKLVTLIATLLAASVITLLLFGNLARKARIEGMLVPDKGLVRVYAPRQGLVTRILVTEGTTVKRGQPLLAVSGETQSQSRGATVEEVIARLAARKSSLTASLDLQGKIFDQRATSLRRQLESTERQKNHLQSEITLQRQSVNVGNQALKRDAKLRKSQLIPVTRLQQTEQDLLEKSVELGALERQLASLETEMTRSLNQLEELPMLRDAELADISRQISAIDQDIAEAEARREIVIAAPQDGTVTTILTEQGGNAFPSSPLMSIVPEASELYAHLFGPSRAIGFVQEGQKLNIRFQPYPYQQFGLYGGVITTVSRSPVSATELPDRFADLARNANEPVFRIIAKLDQQTVKAYGKPVALQPGMKLEADVVIENRSLIDWLLDPLYSLTGKLQG
jgi:membrane fusion protein